MKSNNISNEVAISPDNLNPWYETFIRSQCWAIAIAAAIPLMMNSSVINGVCDFSFDHVHPDCEEVGILSPTRCEIYKNIGMVYTGLLSCSIFQNYSYCFDFFPFRVDNGRTGVISEYDVHFTYVHENCV